VAAQSVGYTCHSVFVLDFGAGRNGDAVRTLVRALLDISLGGAGGKSRADVLSARGGNPLFLDQLLRSAEEAGEEAIPGSVQSLVLSRIDRLEAGDRQALKAAGDDGIIALWVQIDIMADRGDGTAAIEHCEALLDLARRLGAHRFEPFGLLHMGLVMAAGGNHITGVEKIEQAVATTKETGVTFLGPYALGALATARAEEDVGTQALAEAEPLP